MRQQGTPQRPSGMTVAAQDVSRRVPQGAGGEEVCLGGDKALDGQSLGSVCQAVGVFAPFPIVQPLRHEST